MHQNDQEELVLELFRAATEQEQKIAIGMLLHCANQRLAQETDSVVSGWA